jgi:hypothetical protein
MSDGNFSINFGGSVMEIGTYFVSQIPEPSSAILLLSVLVGMVAWPRRQDRGQRV